MNKDFRKWVLKNAYEHDGKAELGAVVSKIIGEHTELRKNINNIIPKIKEIIHSVNKMSSEKQLEELENNHPELLEEDKEEEVRKLPELSDAENGVVMRLAPNPNGPIHLGHTRMIILNDEYVKKYGGTLILKYDDTDPKNENKKPTKLGYESIKKDLDWFGINPDKIVYASDNIPRYYDVFEELLEQNNAYVCDCDWEKWKEMKARGEPCSCRNLSAEDNIKRWNKMLNGDYSEGEAVARVKTDINHKDPAERDWAAFRIIENPEHVRVGNKYCVWPLMDFGNGVDDYDNNTTHILRGMDLAISERRQKWLYNYMGWEYPSTITYGHLMIEGAGTFSKSKIKEGIRNDKYSGWDDPRLGTIISLRRRGFQPDAIREFIKSMSLGGKDVRISFSKLESFNKKLIDPDSDRYFFVNNPKDLIVEEVKSPVELRVSLSPYNKKKYKNYFLKKKKQKFFISNNDFTKICEGDIFRLKDLFNVRVENKNKEKMKGVYSDEQSISKGNPKIQWVKKDMSIIVNVLMPDATRIKGYGEEYLKNLKFGEIVQFERFGFVKLEEKGSKYSFIYTQS